MSNETNTVLIHKLLDQYERNKKKSAEYMKQWRKDHREEWNQKQREMYIKKKAAGTLPPSRQPKNSQSKASKQADTATSIANNPEPEFNSE
jgi:hypothetical protein